MVSSCPEVECRSIDGDWEFILLACDGIWDVLSNQVGKMLVGLVLVLHEVKKYQKDAGDYTICPIFLCCNAGSGGLCDQTNREGTRARGYMRRIDDKMSSTRLQYGRIGVWQHDCRSYLFATSWTIRKVRHAKNLVDMYPRPSYQGLILYQQSDLRHWLIF